MGAPTNQSTAGSGSGGGASGNASGSPSSGYGSTTSGLSNAGPALVGGVGAAGRQGGRGYAVDADLSSWEFWWEFQKDPLLRLRDGFGIRRSFSATDALLGGRGAILRTIEPPSASDVRTIVIPALVKALEEASDRDTISSAMVALAKIGQDPDGVRLHDLFVQRLSSHDQEIRETAALCIGIARQCRREDIAMLVALCTDSPLAQKASARSQVDQRTRAFACYGLGICLGKIEPARRQEPVRALLSLLDSDGSTSTQRNVTVAAIAAIGQLPRDDSPVGRALLDVAANRLMAFYDLDMGPGAQIVQAHCPIAVANLIGKDHAMSDLCRAKFVARLAGDRNSDAGAKAKTNDHVGQSCAAALGSLCRAWENETSPDHAACQELVRTYKQATDHQTRYFAALSIGRIGGENARRALLEEMKEASRAIEQPWIMLALGAMAADRLAASKAGDSSAEIDRDVRDALLRALESAKNPQAIGAAAIALGLCRSPGSADRLRVALSSYGQREDVGGQVAIGLALLGERSASPHIRELLAQSVRQPQLLVRLATALGKLGDAEAVTQLTAMLQDSEGGLARMSAVAAGLGQLGDKRCIVPLVQMLQNKTLTPLTRAFAAVALGGVCDPEPMPWNARYAATLNYRAAVETLTDGAAGILDIL